MTIIDDAVAEDDETLTVSLGNLGGTEVAVDITASGTVTITDEADIAGLTLSETVLTVAEGSTTRTYTVVLNTEPSDMVLVSINQDGEVTTNSDKSGVHPWRLEHCADGHARCCGRCRCDA